MAAKKPQPRTVKVVCSECGLDWNRHTTEAPSLADCVRLLKQELAKRPIWNSQASATGSPIPFYGTVS